MPKDDKHELASEPLAHEYRSLIDRAKDSPGIADVMELYQQNAQLLAQMNAYLGDADLVTFTTSDSTAW